jgi:acetaldehyde dehydrogenase (acetylating)
LNEKRKGTTAERVAGIIRVPNVMEVHPSFPAKTVPEFITYAKTNPGKINFASSGNGSTIHMFEALFKLLKARFAELSASVLPGSPADFGRLVAEETEKWAKVVKTSGAKPD